MNKKCLVDDCPKYRAGRGYCYMHYWQLMHHGDVNHTKPHIINICKIVGCTRRVKGHGFCARHYEIWRKHGNAEHIVRLNEKHGMTNTPTYTSWRGMRDRCSKNGTYTKKGVAVCDAWCGDGGFGRFYTDMGERPLNSTLDRIDVTGNYEPGNCRWATRSQQAINIKIRSNNKSGYRGVTKFFDKWQAYINKDGIRYHLGTFGSKEAAAKAYNIAAVRYHGEDAKPNLI